MSIVWLPNSNLNIGIKIPKEGIKIPKQPWYTGASSHFGEVKIKDYAKQWFDSLFEDMTEDGN